MPKSPNLSYLNHKGKLVHGTAAALHYIFTVKGGLQNYNDEVGTEYIKEFVREHSDVINEGLAKKARKNHLKVV